MSPTKLELLAAWLPGRGWAGAVPTGRIGGYRFDDPAGAVGLETILVTTAVGALLQVPLSYRGAPLAGAEQHLVGTSEHTLLGTRWIYDGCADPVWVSAMMTAILTGGTHATLFADHGDGSAPVPVEPTMTVRGSGSGATPVAIDAVTSTDLRGATVVAAGDHELLVARRVGTDLSAPAVLTGRWDGGEGVLAGVLA